MSCNVEFRLYEVRRGASLTDRALNLDLTRRGFLLRQSDQQPLVASVESWDDELTLGSESVVRPTIPPRKGGGIMEWWIRFAIVWTIAYAISFAVRVMTDKATWATHNKLGIIKKQGLFFIYYYIAVCVLIAVVVWIVSLFSH
jgi:hypothetical protein